MSINVKDAQFGAIGNGQTDDTVAIQKAIDYAKTIATPGGGTYRPSIYFPAGYYYISSPINITNTDGIWLMGDGGRTLSTCIFGHTSGIMFDFSGSSQSGCENLYFLSASPSGSIRSTIGVQFALTSSGGINCGIRNCSFIMHDFPTANNGLGTIGIVNIRSEEFYIHECFIRANTPAILSNMAGINFAGINFTATSRYQTLPADIGSMGVVDITGSSLQSYEKRQPALILNGTNSVNIEGYIGRASGNNGTNETAILCNQYTTNLSIHATIESFSRVFKLISSNHLDGARFDIVIANSTTPSTELFDFTDCFVKGLKVSVSLPNPAERLNRYIIYHEGNRQVNASLYNSEITCYDIVDNSYVISANLLKRAVNVSFNTTFPFEKRSGRLRQLTNNIVATGRNGSVASATIFQFRQANYQLPVNNTNGGYYRLWIDGIIRCGSYTSGYLCTLSFQAQIIANQTYNATLYTPSVTVIILDKNATNPAAIDITGLIVDLQYPSAGIGAVIITPQVIGGGTGEPIYYDGFTEMQSDFLINDPIPLS